MAQKALLSVIYGGIGVFSGPQKYAPAVCGEELYA